MYILFELSREHESLPISEMLSVLDAEGLEFKIIEKNKDIVLIKLEKNKNLKKVKKRISMAFFIDEFLFSSDKNLTKLEEKLKKYELKINGSIAVKYKKRSNSIKSNDIVKLIAKYFTKNRIVNLDMPEIEIRAVITNSKIFVCRKLYEIDRSEFEKRKVQFRPFFSPISLHPKIARALVNLSGVKKNQILLDPFCGTGGILLEAGLIGAKPIGSDIEEKMIKGCKKTLDFYKITNYELFSTDIGNIQNYINSVDAIATDLPYGKSTTTKGEDTAELYDRSFKNISNVLKKESKAVIGMSDKNFIRIAEKYLKFKKIHKIRAHKSLTRYFVVFEK